MCRWFAYVSEDEECLLEDVLITPAHSLSKQVHDHFLPKLLSHDPNNITSAHEISARNRLFNVDGFGVAWYTPTTSFFSSAPTTTTTILHPALYKNPAPPLHDTNFRSICANTSTTACFAHIRAATATAITSVNNHPFVFGRHTFMHNGVLADFSKIARKLCEALDEDSYANISGSTDSEHFAALYMTYLTQGRGTVSWEEAYSVEEMRDSLKKAMGTVCQLQREVLGEGKASANSLNVCATDGRQLVAFRCRNHAVEQPPSLYYSTKAGVTLNRKYPGHPDGEGRELGGSGKDKKAAEEHGKHVIVASEPSTYKQEDWMLIEKNHCLMVDSGMGVRLEEVVYPKEWNAKAVTVGF